MSRLIPMLLALCIGAPALAFDDPVELVQRTTTELFELVEANRDDYQQNPQLLRDELVQILQPRTDIIHSARLVLGRHGRGLEREQIEAFAEALSNVLMNRYASGLLQFRSREQVDILPLAGDNNERMTRVRTRIRLDNGNLAPVDYVLRRSNDEWLVFDVIVEGISYVATFRNQIGEEIRRDGFDRMLARLQSGEIDVDIELNGNNG
jgi:phospholipid transport system substrate-binding protein